MSVCLTPFDFVITFNEQMIDSNLDCSFSQLSVALGRVNVWGVSTDYLILCCLYQYVVFSINLHQPIFFKLLGNTPPPSPPHYISTSCFKPFSISFRPNPRSQLTRDIPYTYPLGVSSECLHKCNLYTVSNPMEKLVWKSTCQSVAIV